MTQQDMFNEINKINDAINANPGAATVTTNADGETVISATLEDGTEVTIENPEAEYESDGGSM
ncbi:hypothetical protein [Streptomyces sp. G1]|uniref:hypothetical protein n=1 Tax=Streptomyces sp. G1 TaxID=361572 RepID=UPI00202F9F37|nr:hypothetical protein [Streptomyces sp. G1]MCM1965129.1 hypothetical protein [Streptomyces sp. G1]